MKRTIEDAARRVQTRLEESHSKLAEVMLAHRAVLATELAALDLALEALGCAPRQAKREPKSVAPTKRATGKKPAKRTAKTSKKTAKKTAPAVARRRRPTDPTAPAPRIGRLPTSVQVKAVDDEADRKRLVDDLTKRGYTRAGIGERLLPGLFDVIRRDGAIVVTWWPKESE